MKKKEEEIIRITKFFGISFIFRYRVVNMYFEESIKYIRNKTLKVYCAFIRSIWCTVYILTFRHMNFGGKVYGVKM